MSRSKRFFSAAVAFATAACVALGVVGTTGCTPGPLSPPTSGAPQNKPVALSSEPTSGALETTRRQLEGTWELVALESVPPGGGARVPVKATGLLTYDGFGNLMIDAQTTDPAAPVAAREVKMLSFKGRAVIDVVNSELKLMDVTGNVDPSEVVAPELRRRYVLDANDLMLSSFTEKGDVTMITTWRRRK